MLLRSAFWLGFGYVVMVSGNPDARQDAEALTAAAVAHGQNLVLEQTENCGRLECRTLNAAILTSKSSPDLLDPEDSQHLTSVPVAPVPPPRPDWAG